MAQQIIIQQELHQMQAAIVEDGRLAEYYLQKDDASPAVGSIYSGIFWWKSIAWRIYR